MGISALKTFIRAPWRHRGFAAINIIGLAVSLAVSLLALLFIWQQWRVDRVYADADRIRRVTATHEGTRYDTSLRPLRAARIDPADALRQE